MPSMSEKNTIVTNGMSEYKRDSGFANSAVLVGITPDDYGKGVFDGIVLQESLEKKSFEFVATRTHTKSKTTITIVQSV